MFSAKSTVMTNQRSLIIISSVFTIARMAKIASVVILGEDFSAATCPIRDFL